MKKEKLASDKDKIREKAEKHQKVKAQKHVKTKTTGSRVFRGPIAHDKSNRIEKR
jgi:hypothetical protein